MTGRLPFDPKQMKKPASDPTASKAALVDRPLTVTELAARVDSAIKAGLPARIRVLGEISGLRHRTHFYFTIKDEGAAISAVVFASTARRLSSPPADGAQVIATGRIEFYAPSGKLSLIIDRLEPVGKGPLEERFRQLASDLKQLGWFDPERKKPMPTFPRCVAVVTSRTGAALQDVLDTARRRCPSVSWLVVDARVQGDAAIGEISRAIRLLGANHEQLGIDAILITRGGGSLEDLWAFNEREVAQAIWECPLPVIAAIGHETDTTIAELVADERAATPTQAAMRLTPDKAAILEQTRAISRRLEDSTRGRLRFARERLRRFADRPVFTSPGELVRPHADRVQRAQARLQTAVDSQVLTRRSQIDRLGIRLERLRPSNLHARREERLRGISERLGRVAHRAVNPQRVDRAVQRLHLGIRARVSNLGVDLDGLTRELEAVSPIRVLRRGYSVTLDKNGKAITTTGDLRPGDRVRTRVTLGEFESEVISQDQGASSPPSPPVTPQPDPRPMPKRGRRGSGKVSKDQMDLFGLGG